MKRIILMACLLVMTAVMAQAQLKREYGKTTSSSPVFGVTASPDIPMTVNFAGETVSFDRLDMAERLDRELTGIIYGQTTTELCFKRANRYFPALAKILKEQGIPLDFLYLAVTESSMDYNAYSSAKAAGMWQLLAGTGRDFGLEVGDEVDERYDPEKSTVAACKYLKAAYKKYGHWPTVAASYTEYYFITLDNNPDENGNTPKMSMAGYLFGDKTWGSRKASTLVSKNGFRAVVKDNSFRPSFKFSKATLPDLGIDNIIDSSLYEEGEY